MNPPPGYILDTNAFGFSAPDYPILNLSSYVIWILILLLMIFLLLVVVRIIYRQMARNGQIMTQAKFGLPF